MCDNCCNNYSWQNNFYNQYMQQHSAMMQWIQNLHSNIDVQGAHHVNPIYQHNGHRPKAVHYDCMPIEYNPFNDSNASENHYSSSTDSTTDSGKIDESFEAPEYDESDCEYELNVDAILAMRKAKEELLKKDTSTDSSSIVMIDHENEDFEFLELGTVQETESKRSVLVGGTRNRNAELKHEKAFKEQLYGERSMTIAGLETAMSLTYERLCDIHQPSIWPVYPLRLSTSHI